MVVGRDKVVNPGLDADPSERVPVEVDVEVVDSGGEGSTRAPRIVELMLAGLSPCESTREGIEEAVWEAYGKGWG
jgi:hypothetical protein